jgi:hypothetical protein
MLEEIDNFDELGFGLFDSCNILEAFLDLGRLIVNFCPVLAKRKAPNSIK